MAPDSALELQLLVPTGAESRLDLAIRAWIDRQASACTRQTYAPILDRFRGALQALGLDLDSDRRGDIALIAEKWCRAKHDPTGRPLGGQVGDPTFVQRLSALSSFYIYAIRYELIGGPNPIARITRPAKQAYRNVEALPIDPLRQALARIDRTTMDGARDYALLAVALQTGRRRSELVGLRWSRAHLVDDKIKLTWVVKGGDTHHDLLPRRTTGAILRWLQRFYGPDLGALRHDDPLWPSLSDRNYGAPISGQTLADICQRRLGFSAVHTIRHSYAKTLEAKGLSPADIMRQLGHKSLKTTTIYLARLRDAENPIGDILEEELGIE